MTERPVKFAIVGLDHDHAYIHARMLTAAGAVLASCYSQKPEHVAEFCRTYPDVMVANSEKAILEDPSIEIIAGSPMPADRAATSIRAMQHGKDVLVDKPPVVSVAQLEEVERVQRETGRIWCLYSNEHHDRRCTVRALELTSAGAIGRVVQTTGLGPHQLSRHPRPDWFFNRSTSGGIIGDIGTHQIEQFLAFTGSTEAEITLAQTGNFGNAEHPEFEDYGEVSLIGNGGLGWFRVDWYSPANLGAPGDIRLFVLGTEGYLETRKYIDPDGRPGAEHLLLANRDGIRFIDTAGVEMTFGRRFLEDVRRRTETAIPQSRSFLAARLAAQAQTIARRLGADHRGGA